MEKNLLIDRLKNCLNCVKNQNSGADIHTVGNIRNSAQGLQHILETEAQSLNYHAAEEWCKRIEKQVIDFYKSKYQYHFSKV